MLEQVLIQAERSAGKRAGHPDQEHDTVTATCSMAMGPVRGGWVWSERPHRNATCGTITVDCRVCLGRRSYVVSTEAFFGQPSWNPSRPRGLQPRRSSTAPTCSLLSSTGDTWQLRSSRTQSNFEQLRHCLWRLGRCGFALTSTHCPRPCSG